MNRNDMFGKVGYRSFAVDEKFSRWYCIVETRTAVTKKVNHIFHLFFPTSSASTISQTLGVHTLIECKVMVNVDR